MAVGDLDNDGRVDVVFNSIDQPAKVLRNETPGQNHWIILNLVGTRSNRDGIGAQVKITTAAGSQYAMVTTASSYQSSSDKRLHFGLAADAVIARVEIRWPSGIKQELSDLKADQIVTILEATSSSK